MTVSKRPAKIVVKSTTRKRTSTGAARCISVTGVGRCGGAVESRTRTTGAASSASTSQKKTKTKIMRRGRQPRRGATNTLAAIVAAN